MLLLLVAIAAAILVFAMMMVLFSADGKNAAEFSDQVFHSRAILVVSALALGVVIPPLLLVLRVPTLWCLLPAGLGFVVAGGVTLWTIIQNV